MTEPSRYRIDEGLPRCGVLVRFKFELLDSELQYETTGFLVQHYDKAYFKTTDGLKISLERVVWWKHIPIIDQ